MAMKTENVLACYLNVIGIGENFEQAADLE